MKGLFPLQGWKAGVTVIISQIIASVIVNAMDYSILYRILPWLRPFGWERNGKIYDSVFRIRRWKDYIPSVSAFDKKELASSPDAGYLSRFVLESVRAELCHILAIIAGLAICLLTPAAADIRILLWMATVNFPCIMIQRYNRPRLMRILNRPRQDGTSGLELFWIGEKPDDLRSRGRT